MKLKRKKKTVIPKNITKQNIDMFNSALGNTSQASAGGSVTGTASAGCSESLNEKFYYDDYTDDQIESACWQLVDDYVEPRYLIQDFLDYNRDYELKKKMRNEFGLESGDEVSNEEAEEILDKYLFEICMTVDEPFIQKCLRRDYK